MDGEEELPSARELADTSGPTDLIGHNVPVHTSLPPQVEGHLRCFLCLCISQIRWVVQQHPARTFVHITWWGETGSGTIFRPFDGSKKDKNNLKTTARYPVRSGPKQFKSYLNDMNVLLLEIMDGDSLEIIGYAEVDHIATLTTYSPLKSIYAVSSLEDEKIAELHVSVTLEPLMESYDSSGFLPTVDISNTQTFQLTKPDLFSERMAATHSIKASSAHPLQRETQQSQIPQNDTTVSITTGGNVVLTHNGFSGNESEDTHPAQNANSPDLISVLLEKGNKLRETMVLSMADELPKKQRKQNLENPEMSLPISRSSSYGSLLREILTADDCPATNIGEDSEDRVIDLVMGPNHEELVFNNPHDSSVSSLEINKSDISDPLHEAELLQDLFYTNQLDKELLPVRGVRSQSISSLEDLANQRPSSRRSSLSDNHEDGTEESIKPTIEKKSKVSTKPKSPILERKSSLAKSKTTAKSKPPAKPKSLYRPKSPLVRQKLPLSRPKSPLHTVDSPRSKVTAKSVTSPKIKRSPRSSPRTKKLKKKGRRRSGSVTASGSDASDTDSVYSESSRVSFDMAPSDVEEEQNECAANSKRIDGLSVERLTLLGRATVARVAVEALDLLSPASRANPEKKSGASNKSIGKPPKPRLLPQKSNSYFLEYQFPVVAAARDKYTPNTMATEVTRAVAKQVKENTVNFNHHSVFPLLFDGASIENWWKSAINFKIYSRTPDQKTPSLIGCCQLPLKSILKAENLCLGKTLLVCKPGKQSGSACSSSSQIGNLKVSVDIGSDSADFSSALSRTRIAELHGKSKIVPIASTSSKRNPVRKPREQLLVEEEKSSLPDADTSVNTADLLSIDSHQFLETNHKIESKSSHPIYPDNFKSAAFQTTATVHQTPFNSFQNAEDLEPLALHSLLIINEGRKISKPQQNALHPVQGPNILQGQSRTDVRNIYLQCRMFWCDQAVNSSVCWGTNDPQFNFVQVSPVIISPSLLERMRNNYLVIEVWDKKNATQDELVGIVKLSLHQFYLSLRNKRITSALLKAQYPIIAHDCFVPIVDPLSNCQHGQLKVLLAIGSVEQVSTLQRVTLDRYMSFTFEKETTRNLDTIGVGRISESEEFVEHLFEIVIEDINHLPQLEEITWGETDCFIQYFFPFQTRSQSSEEETQIGQQAILKTFRTATTPCIPDPSFQSITKHKFILYSALPMQTQLLNTFVDNEGNVSEVCFELWGRFYHPNVRDQVIAKATLPLVKLFAMVSMYKKEPLLQSFCLPLVSSKADTPEMKNQKTGHLNVTITYKSQMKHSPSKLSKSPSSTSSLYISVGLLRVCGLQAAAEYCASYDSSMQYPCEVGVNTYIKAKLSFIHDRTCTTRTFPRNFCPEVGQFFEFHCPLINKDSCSLAETLESAELYIEFWHQVPAEIEPNSHLNTFEDVLLGVTEVPLIGLLTNNNGIHSWLPINRPSTGTFLGKLDSHFTNQLEYVMGGTEVKVNFTHTNDQERLLYAADTVGWNLPERYLVADNFEDFEDGLSLKVSINIDEVTVAKKNCLSPEQTSNSVSQCYLKYNFHDKGPFASKPLPFRVKGKDFLFAKGGHQNSFNLPLTAPLVWYLKEEKVEVQLWCGSGGGGLGHQFHRNRDPSRDRLIGSAWIPLAGLCHGQEKKVHRISGIYPMFKAGLPNLRGMYIRAHISLHFQKVQDEEPTPEELSNLDSDWNDSFLAPDSADFVNVFQVHISIEQAMHLTQITDKSTGKLCQPNAYVSFTTAHKNKMASTNVIFDEDCPVWEYDLNTILNSELLYEENKNLVFKVWHKPANVPKEPDKSSDQVIGFVSVDMAPLVSGLKQLCGWYNIIDFSGRCKGQVKLSVTPLESIVHHWNQLKSHMIISQTDDKSGSSQMSLPHFSEHYNNVKLHHELLQNQHQSYTPNDDATNSAKIPGNSIVKKVAFASDSSSRSQLMSKLQQQMVELDELNAHLKSKLRPIPLSTEEKPVIYPTSQEIGFSLSSEQNPKEEGATSCVNLDLAKQTETPNVGEDLYTEQFSTVDKYLADDFNNTIPRNSAAAAAHMKIPDEKKDEFFSSGQMHEEGEGSDYLFTAYPIGHLSSSAVPPPEWNENHPDLTTVDSELFQIFSQQAVDGNSVLSESGLEEPLQIHLDKDTGNYIQDFKTRYGEIGAEKFHVRDDDSDIEMEDSDEDEESVVIPRIVNDISYILDEPPTLMNEEQDNEVNPSVTTEREFLENIRNPTDKKPPDGFGVVPNSQSDFSDDNVDSLSDPLDIPTNRDISYNSIEEFQAGNDSPEIGKHFIFEEELHVEAEATTAPYLPPDNVLVERNSKATVDEVLSTDPNKFQEERLSPNAFAMEGPHPSANRSLFQSNHGPKNPVPTIEDEPELSTKENFQNKPPIKVSGKHPVKKILHTNFFLPLADLEQSMRAVKLSTAIKTYKSVMDSLPGEKERTPDEKLYEKAYKDSKVPIKYTSLPAKEESDRIARIFSMKLS